MEKTVQNLEKNGFEVIMVDHGWKALDVAKKLINDGESIGLGGSTTVDQIGLLCYIDSLSAMKKNKVFNQYEKGIDMEENVKRRREGMLADVYVTGCNAITQNGELINADGDGNRVAAQIFGPKRVLLFVGVNKIVKDKEEAEKRIMEVAAVKNIERMNNKAKSMGKEPRYNLENIANKFTCINGDKEGRTTIILIKEDLGF